MNEFDKDNLINYHNIKGRCSVIMDICKSTIKSSNDDLKSILSKFGIAEEVYEFEFDLEPCETFIKNIEVYGWTDHANAILTAYIHKESLLYNYRDEIYFTWIYDSKGCLTKRIYRLEFNNSI